MARAASSSWTFSNVSRSTSGSCWPSYSTPSHSTTPTFGCVRRGVATQFDLRQRPLMFAAVQALLAYNEQVGGSSPSAPTKYGSSDFSGVQMTHAALSSVVDLAAMRHSNDQDEKLVIVDLVHD